MTKYHYHSPIPIALTETTKTPMVGFITGYEIDEDKKQTHIDYEVNGKSSARFANLIMATFAVWLAAPQLRTPQLMAAMWVMYAAGSYVSMALSHIGSETYEFGKELKRAVKERFQEKELSVTSQRGNTLWIDQDHPNAIIGGLTQRVKGVKGRFTFNTQILEQTLARATEEQMPPAADLPNVVMGPDGQLVPNEDAAPQNRSAFEMATAIATELLLQAGQAIELRKGRGGRK